MTFAFGRVLFAASLLASGACSVFDAKTGDELDFRCSNEDSDPTKAVSFANDIRPLMNRVKTDPTGPGCKSCHYDTGDTEYETRKGILEGGLNMTTLGDLRKGGKTSLGATAIAGKPCDSAIIRKLRGIYPTGARMPKDSPRFLNDTEIQLFSDWIAEGAKGEDSQ